VFPYNAIVMMNPGKYF